MSGIYPFHLFEVTGIELEYMIVDRKTLNVKPVADQLLALANGGIPTDYVERGDIAWSNELVNHVIEFKTTDPVPTFVGMTPLDGVAEKFEQNIIEANRLLEPLGAMLLPTGMHPWMDPLSETVLWQDSNTPVYRAYDRIFSCKGHGWANLQSMHINLPFGDEIEFVKLHSAIRMVLPLIPALAASSPLMEGRLTGLLDNRLETYRLNQRTIPSITGHVIPESVNSIADYHERILQQIYNDIAPYDTDNILQAEWLNSRGAIARFGRGAIEIRLADVQDKPQADVAIAAAIIEVVKMLVEERYLPEQHQRRIPEESLEAILLAAIREGGNAGITDPLWLSAFGIRNRSGLTLRSVWRLLMDEEIGERLSADQRAQIENILTNGTLAERIIRQVGTNPTRESIYNVYRGCCP